MRLSLPVPPRITNRKQKVNKKVTLYTQWQIFYRLLCYKTSDVGENHFLFQ